MIDLKKQSPENKTHTVIKYLDRIFVRTKVIYDVPTSFAWKEPASIEREILAIISEHKGKGEMIVLVFAQIETIPLKVLTVLKSVFEKIIEENHVSVWCIFPKNLHGNMEELYTYISELNRIENKCSVMLKTDNREEKRKIENKDIEK